MKQLLLIFLHGIIILIGAIILNLIAKQIGFVVWHDFLKTPDKAGAISYLWLFLIYPLGIGAIAYFTSKHLPNL
ncbi:hypothetical protein GF340_00175 [Candidatus Peregrinibacteria bacterium]|nr:hypothetical protein [Candidatus Peregrinibacteria bacterium]